MAAAAVEKYDWDEDLAERSLAVLEAVCTHEEGKAACSTSRVVSTVLTLGLKFRTREEIVSAVLWVTESAMGVPTGPATVCSAGGISSLVSMLNVHIRVPELVSTSMSLLVALASLPMSSTHVDDLTVAFSLVRKSCSDPPVLELAYALLERLALMDEFLQVRIVFLRELHIRPHAE